MEGLAGIDMNSFYDAFAKTIPLLGVFVGAIPAAVTGLLTLGGAAVAAAGTLAAVGGLSIAGLAYQLGGGDIQAGIEEIRSRLTTQAEQSFAPLMDRFDDLGADGLRGLEKFIDRIAEESVALTSLKDEARDFGEWVFNVVPEAIDDVVALTEAFAPLFGMGASWLTNTDILGGFVETTDDVLPSILTIIDAFLQILPVVVQFSEGMLMVTAAVFEFWSVVWGAIDALGPFATGLGIAVGALLALYTHLTLLNTAMGAFSTVTGKDSVSALRSYIMTTRAATMASTYFNTAIMRLAGTSMVKFISSMLGSIPVIGSYITSIGIATVATYALAAAIAATGIGLLLVGLNSLGGAFLSTGGKIDEATKSLENFKSARDGLGGGPGIDNPYGPLPSDAQTAVEGNGSGGDTTVNNSTTNVEVNTDGSRKDGINARHDLDHALFRKNELSSSPY